MNEKNNSKVPRWVLIILIAVAIVIVLAAVPYVTGKNFLIFGIPRVSN